jgi:purine-binding chemotaxis protein CheW
MNKRILFGDDEPMSPEEQETRVLAEAVRTPDEAVPGPLVIFSLDDQRYALPLDQVQRSIRVVAITPLPEAPAIVLGIIDLAGVVIPVINLRERFKLRPRAIRLSDHLIIANTGRLTVALLADETMGVIQVPRAISMPSSGIMSGLGLVDGAIKLSDGLILIHDLERLLSLEEESEISRGLRAFSEASGSHGPKL